MLSEEQVRKVAELSRLKLTGAEIAAAASHLAGILDYVAVLNEVEVSGVEPLAHAADVVNALRDDAVTPGLPRSDALANAPKSDGRFFLVPQILEHADA